MNSNKKNTKKDNTFFSQNGSGLFTAMHLKFFDSSENYRKQQACKPAQFSTS